MVFIFSEAGPCPKHNEALVGIRTALWRAPLAFTSMVIADTDEKELPKNRKKKRATFNLIKKQRKLEPPGGTGDLLWSQWNVVKGIYVRATLPTGQATGLRETPKCNMNDCNSTNLISSDNPLFYELQDEEEALSPVKTRFTKYQLFCNTYFRLFSPGKRRRGLEFLLKTLTIHKGSWTTTRRCSARRSTNFARSPEKVGFGITIRCQLFFISDFIVVPENVD